jgi:hypothetical protein
VEAEYQMSKIEEFLRLNFKRKSHTFNRQWLEELQEEVKAHYAQNTQGATMAYYTTKLKDCQEDKARILQGLTKVLEDIYEAPIKIQVLSPDEEDSELEDSEEDNVGK